MLFHTDQYIFAIHIHHSMRSFESLPNELEKDPKNDIKYTREDTIKYY